MTRDVEIQISSAGTQGSDRPNADCSEPLRLECSVGRQVNGYRGSAALERIIGSATPVEMVAPVSLNIRAAHV